MPDQSTLCLVPIPFSDLSSSKKRPVIVISNDEYNKNSDDVLVMAVTSNPQPKKYSLLITKNDMEQGTILKDSVIRADKIYSISKGIITKKFGKISTQKYSEAIQNLCAVIR